MIALTLITSKTVITKQFRLRGQSLEKMETGTMASGCADGVEVPDLRALIPVIDRMSTRQALAYGTLTVPGDHHEVTTKNRQIDGKNISRSRAFFEFKPDQEGVLLIDYDPPKTEKPLPEAEVLQMLEKVCPALAQAEKLIISSASSHIYRKSDNACLRGEGGLHILVRVQNSAEIPAIGKALEARLWLAGFGYVGKSKDDKAQVRCLIDTSVWQPERLSFECGSECGAGLEQRKPPIRHIAGTSLSLEDVAVSDEEVDRSEALKAAAKGQKPPKVKKSTPTSRAAPGSRADADAPAPIPTEPLSPSAMAKIMGALLHVPASCEYETWLKIGMALKSECGMAGLQIWDNWSKASESYPGAGALRAKFASFDRSDVKIGTLYFYAQQYGWNPRPKKKSLDELCPLPVLALPAADHEPLAQTVAVEEAGRAITEKLFNDIILSAEKNRVSAAQITTGVGKTSSLRKMLTDVELHDKYITIVAKDRQQCREYEEAGAFWRHGRELTQKGFTNAWHCPKASADGPVARLGEKEHRLQQMCKSGHCEHGNVMMLKRAEKKGAEPSTSVIQFFKDRPELKYAEPCQWFDHNDEGKKHNVRVVTAAGLNASDLETGDHQPIDHLIIDESVQWAHSQFLGLGDIRKAIEALNRVIDQAREAAPGAGFGVKAEPEIAKALEGPLATFQILAEAMGKHAAAAATGAYTPIDFDLGGILRDLGDGTDENGSAFWEKPEWNHWTDLISVPLRALAAIREGAQAGSLSMVDGQLHVTYLHSSLTEARGKGINIMIMDATLDETAKAIVGQDNITQVVAHPNLTWKIDPRWFKSAKNKEAALVDEALLLLDTRKKMEAKTRHASYIQCRKELALTALAISGKIAKKDVLAMDRETLWAFSIEHCIGWWGWHDVAHDEWGGLDALLWGQIPIPDAVRMQEYMDHRACLLMLGKIQPEDLPMADNRWSPDQMVYTGDHLQKSLARLPDQPEIRDWLLRTVTNKKIQGAGRSRSARQERQIVVWQIGGYPPVGLEEHGIRPQYERLQEGLSGTEVAAIHSDQRMRMMDAAAAHLVASGENITRAGMRESVATLCNSLISKEASGQISVRDAYIYIYQSRTLNEAQGCNENNDLEQPFFKNDGVWSDEYAIWREKAQDCIKVRFARGEDLGQGDLVEVKVNGLTGNREIEQSDASQTIISESVEATQNAHNADQEEWDMWEIEPEIAGFEPIDLRPPAQRPANDPFDLTDAEII